MPPTRNQGEPSEAKIVSELGKEFNIDEVYNNESSFIGSLKSIDDLNPVEVPPSRPLNFDEIFTVLVSQVTLGAPDPPSPKGKHLHILYIHRYFEKSMNKKINLQATNSFLFCIFIYALE
jgi:hypothetical protein